MIPLPTSRSPAHMLRWLVYSHVWMAACTGAQVWWTFMFLEKWESMIPLVTFAFFGTISAYGFMRLMRARGDLVEQVPLFGWVYRNRRSSWILVILTGGIALLAILPLLGKLLGLLLWVVPICLLYVLPFGYPARHIGLRAIPAMKVPLVGLVWAMVTVCLPLRSAGVPLLEDRSMLLFLQRLLFVMALTIAFDIRDSTHDPPSLRTLPQLFGDHRARWIAIGMIALAGAISVFFSARGPEPPAMHLWPLFGWLISSVLIHRSHRMMPELYFSFAIDGMLILVPVLAWIGSAIG